MENSNLDTRSTQGLVMGIVLQVTIADFLITIKDLNLLTSHRNGVLVAISYFY